MGLDVYLQVMIAAVQDGTAGICAATSTVVETHIATHREDVLSILMRLDSLRASATSDSSIRTSSDPLGLEAALPPS